MNIKELLKRNRSVRRFDASRKIKTHELRELANLARYCASGRNLQPLKYRIVNSEEECEAVFRHLKWAGYYENWDGPAPSERPVAYLVQCLDTDIAKDCLCDDGLQLEAITLGATERGLGNCIIKAFNPFLVAEELGIPEHLKPRYVLALGYPAETVRLVEMDEEKPDGFKYFRDAEDAQCVPKRHDLTFGLQE